MKKSGIYKITSPSNRIYIGQSSDLKERFRRYKHLHRSKLLTKLYRSFLKYGIENHKFEIIEECLPELLNERERYWQDYYNVNSKNGLNCRLTTTEYEELEFYDEPLAIRSAESIYIKKPFLVEDVIKVICGFERGEDDYDVIANTGYGQVSSMIRRSIVGKKGIWKVSVDCIEDITIKPLSDFSKDYPKFNRKNYELLMEAVDNFYDN